MSDFIPPYVKLNRNDLCWCGSGKKYKRCHLNSAEEKPINSFEAANALKRNFSKGYCLLKSFAGIACSRQIVRAHTIQRSGSLTKIARDGHVILLVLSHNSLLAQAKLVGINQATTFNGFCSKHDHKVFIPLEATFFSGSPQQCALLALRAAGKELYAKEATMQSRPLFSSLSQGKPFPVQVEMQAFVHHFFAGSESGYNNIKFHLSRIKQLISASKFEEMHSLIIKVNSTPEVMVCGGFCPEFDFHGNAIQNLADLNIVPAAMFVTSFAGDNGGFCTFTWHMNDDRICVPFIESFLDQENIPNAFIRLCFEHFENHAIEPDWWDSLSDNIKNELLRRVSVGGSPLQARNNDCLQDDRLNYVNWNIADIQKFGF